MTGLRGARKTILEKPMLILTRRVNETLNIGDDVQVTVLGVKGNQVRIGINAPRDVPVHREEIYQRIKREEAQGAAGDDAGSEGSDDEQGFDDQEDYYEDDESYGNQ